VAGDFDKARGERIEQLMTAQGWTPAHLARVIRADRKAIYEWKDGKRVSSEALERLVLALGTSRRFIETGEGEMFVPREEAPAVLIRQLADALDEQASPAPEPPDA
jgi:transcriptional regulator with XRE-family HTH domain